MPDVSLLTTLHDVKGWSIEPLQDVENIFNACYDKRFVKVTKNTSKDVIKLLEATGWVIVPNRSNVGVEYISDSRRNLIQTGIEEDSEFMHLVDMDRVLHWALTYPDELRDVVKLLPNNDFIIYGRTTRAFNTHPQNQVETEALVNKVFSLIYGKYLDITSASRGLSLTAAETILKFSKGQFFDSDSEWPIIIFCKSDIPISYREVEGLEWETRIKRNEWILPNGKTIDIKEFYESNAESWVYRLMLAHRIAKAAQLTYEALRTNQFS